MSTDKIKNFMKRWRDLQDRRKQLDFEVAILARDMRAEFEDGEKGDRDYIAWLRRELGLTSPHAKAMLDRARMVARIVDAKLWTSLGGFAQIRALDDLAPAQASEVLELARSTGKTVRAAMRDIATPVERPPSICADAREDARELAQFISFTAKEIPPGIAALVERYTARRRRRAA